MGSLSLLQGIFLTQGSPTLQAASLSREPQGKPKNSGVGSLFLLQGIFPTQELNWGLLHCRRILYQLSYQGSPEPLPQPGFISHSCPTLTWFPGLTEPHSSPVNTLHSSWPFGLKPASPSTSHWNLTHPSHQPSLQEAFPGYTSVHTDVSLFSVFLGLEMVPQRHSRWEVIFGWYHVSVCWVVYLGGSSLSRWYFRHLWDAHCPCTKSFGEVPKPHQTPTTIYGHLMPRPRSGCCGKKSINWESVSWGLCHSTWCMASDAEKMDFPVLLQSLHF